MEGSRYPMAQAKILIVEDDKIGAGHTRDVLTGLGYGIAGISSSGAEGIRKVSETHPDLVLMDIVLKGDIDGVKAAEQIKARFDIPVVYLTAYADENILRRAKITEPYGYILKPFEERELHSNIEIALYKHRMAKQLKESHQEAEEEKAKAEAIIEAIGDAFSIQDTDFKFLYMNQIAKDMFGDHVGEYCYKIYEGRDEVCGECPIAMSFADGKIHRVERRNPTRTLHVEITASPIRDSTGKIVAGIEVARDITKRKQAEEELKESEERYRNLFESAHDMVQSVSPEGRLIFVNTSWLNTMGYTPDELRKISIFDILHPSCMGHCMEIFKRVMSGEAADNIEAKFIAKGGRLIDVEGNVSVRSVGGKVIATQGIFRDITERKKATEEIQEQLKFSQLLIDTIPNPVFYKDADGKYVGCNKAFEAFIGMSREEIIGKTVYDLAPEELADAYYEKDLELFRNPGIQVYDFPVKYMDGTRHDVIFNKATYTDATGAVAGLIGVMVDVTERKKMEREILEVKHDWEDTFNNITDIITVHDRDFKVIHANKAAEKILRLTDLEVTKHINCLHEYYYHGTSCLPEQCPSCHCLKTGKPITYEIFEPNLNMFFETRAIPRLDNNNQLIGLIHVVRDITERRRAEDERAKLELHLRHAQKMKAIGTLTAGISHEFNNILTAIIGYIDLLHEGMDKNDPLQRYVNIVQSSALRAANLTQGLMAYSRKQILNPKPVNLNEIIRRVEKLLLGLIREDIELKSILAGEDIIAMADSGQIEQVLMNLCINAKDAMPKGGLLTLKTEIAELDEEFNKIHGYGKPGEYALISVTDTGIGMDEKTGERIFEPFFTTKESGKGTGLGLAVVYGIIKQHKGYINLYSEPDKGTSFKIYLPLIKLEVEEAKNTNLPPVKGGTETILVAEDDAAVRKLTKDMLEKFGYKVISVENGEDAVNEFKANVNDIRLLVMDVMMPKKNGKEAYEEIKKITPDIKALFMSGYAEDLLHKEGTLDEGLKFILKPLSPILLLRTVRAILDK